MRTYCPEVMSVVATTDEVAAMFTTLAFFLMAVLLLVGVIADSLWGRI
jgi:hypothetical protein